MLCCTISLVIHFQTPDPYWYGNHAIPSSSRDGCEPRRLHGLDRTHRPCHGALRAERQVLRATKGPRLQHACEYNSRSFFYRRILHVFFTVKIFLHALRRILCLYILQRGAKFVVMVRIVQIKGVRMLVEHLIATLPDREVSLDRLPVFLWL